MPTAKRSFVLALLVLGAQATPGPALSQAAPHGGTEEIGTWLLSCTADPMTDRTECRLLHRQPVEPAAVGRAPLTLEVVDRGGLLVPVVTARNLTIEGVGRGLLALTGTAQLRFPPEQLVEMPCGLEGRSVVCAPRPEDARRVAAELPGAERVLVRVAGLLDGEGDRAEPTELRLSRTGERPGALARARPGRRPSPARLGHGPARCPDTRAAVLLALRAWHGIVGAAA